MTIQQSSGLAPGVAMALRLAAAALAGVLLFACSAGAGEKGTASSSREAPTETLVPPSKRFLAGTWREVRGTVRVRFARDSSFKIGERLDTPFATGTYTLSRGTLRFRPVGPWCLDPWVWRVSVRKLESRLEDELNVLFVTRACDVAKGTKWRLARIS